MEKEIKLHVDEGLWHRAKVAAAMASITLKALCTKAITEEVEHIEQDNKGY